LSAHIIHKFKCMTPEESIIAHFYPPEADSPLE